MPTIESNRLVKANDIRPLGSKVAFNYEDLRKNCDEYVSRAKEQARQLIEAAQNEAETIRRQASEAGRRDGRAQGLQDAKDEIDLKARELSEQLAAETLSTVLPAMTAAANMLQLERDRWLIEWETGVIRLCVAIAEKILRRKLEQEPEIGRDLILEAVKHVTGNTQLKLKLNPTDLERLGDYAEEVVRSIASCGEATLVADSSVTPGGCVIETQHGTVDARLETQLQRIADELIQ